VAAPHVGWAAILATIAISAAVQVRFRANLARAVVFRGLRSSAVAVSGDTADSPGVR
jgi:hypothetical protein